MENQQQNTKYQVEYRRQQITGNFSHHHQINVQIYESNPCYWILSLHLNMDLTTFELTPAFLLEIVGVACWAIYLFLVVRENIWCWPFAIIGASITIFLFYQNKIYMEALINVYYVGAASYGWYYWSKHKISEGRFLQNEKKKVPVILWSWKVHLITFLATALFAFGLGHLMKTYTDSARPFVDAGLASFSFLATMMETRKVLTCWVYWFLVNIGLATLQIDRGIYLYAGLSSLFVIMSVFGFIGWRKSYLSSNSSSNS